jgi:hypothetical protein
MRDSFKKTPARRYTPPGMGSLMSDNALEKEDCKELNFRI